MPLSMKLSCSSIFYPCSTQREPTQNRGRTWKLHTALAHSFCIMSFREGWSKKKVIQQLAKLSGTLILLTRADYLTADMWVQKVMFTQHVELVERSHRVRVAKSKEDIHLKMFFFSRAHINTICPYFKRCTTYKMNNAFDWLLVLKAAWW